MPNTDDYFQSEQHKAWKRNPASYDKPKHDPLAPRVARLMHNADCISSLSYIVFLDGERIHTAESGGMEFIFDDPEPFRAAMLSKKIKAGFHVYYKHGSYWYGIPQHFDELHEAIPYLQSGHRVIIEYRFTKKDK